MSRRERIEAKGKETFGFPAGERIGCSVIDSEIIKKVMKQVVLEVFTQTVNETMLHAVSEGWHNLDEAEAKAKIENYLNSRN